MAPGAPELAVRPSWSTRLIGTSVVTACNPNTDVDTAILRGCHELANVWPTGRTTDRRLNVRVHRGETGGFPRCTDLVHAGIT